MNYPDQWLSMRSEFTNLEVNKMLYRAEIAEAEVQRLKSGDFTEEEFQNLCHNRIIQEGACRFKEGCEQYTLKLFGCNLWEKNNG